MDRSNRLHRGALRYEIDFDGRSSSGQSSLRKGSEDELRRLLELQVEYGLRSLAT